MEKMERSVDLSKLPTKKYGTGTCIDWEKAVGQKIPFCYDNVKGEFTIVEHQKGNYIVIKYKNKEKRTRTSHLTEGKFRDLVFDDNKLVRKIDFSSIPQKYGRNDWMHSKGCILPFYYDGIKGNIEIIDCKSNDKGMTYLTVKYKNRMKDIRNINLWNCKIANVIGYHTGDYIFDKGEKIVDAGRNLTIIGQKHYESAGVIRKGYKYHCNICRIHRLGR
ncbi:MAG: hypothetical protein ACI4VH_03495 [Clostridia bacterium]